jgi:hypothetical protein
MRTTIIDIHKKNGKRPAFDVYIGRSVVGTEFTEDSKWANPFRAKQYADRSQCLRDYEGYIRNKIEEDPAKYDLRELVGKRLGCWCTFCDNVFEQINLQRYDVCHGQILRKLMHEFGIKQR